MNSIFLDTLNKKDTDRPPVWFMRQAGRILPSYQELKKIHSFSDLMNSPELAAKVTLLPINDLGVDAAILFSDILIVPEALGMGLEFTEKGPVFSKPLTQFKNPSEQLIVDRSKLTHVYDNIDEIIKTRHENTPLIGFCGGPLTTFCFMFRGHARDVTFNDAIKFIYSNPSESKKNN
jgi:uroporphyrinogen decarboxylase